MSEYARRNLVCSSWHTCPDGWHSWSGMVRGFTTRPFCLGNVGHAGDHNAWIEPIADPDGQGREMTWPNTLGMPEWLISTAIHAIETAADHIEDPTTRVNYTAAAYRVTSHLDNMRTKRT